MSFDWTDDAVAALKQHEAGELSMSKIAAELSSVFGTVSRNAVIGKLHRLGIRRGNGYEPTRLKPRPKRPVVHRIAAPKKRKVSVLKRTSNYRANNSLVELVETEITDIAPEDIPLAQRKTLLELTDHTCRWPIGEPSSPDFFFCGGPADLENHQPYCRAHMMRARNRLYRPPVQQPWMDQRRKHA